MSNVGEFKFFPSDKKPPLKKTSRDLARRSSHSKENENWGSGGEYYEEESDKEDFGSSRRFPKGDSTIPSGYGRDGGFSVTRDGGLRRKLNKAKKKKRKYKKSLKFKTEETEKLKNTLAILKKKKRYWRGIGKRYRGAVRETIASQRKKQQREQQLINPLTGQIIQF